jgi:large subunit ribosomal protein L10
MGMTRTEKQALIENLHQEFGKSPHAILVDFRGLSVPAVTEFRRKVKATGSRYRVVKNTLALRAAKGTPLEKLGPQFDNTTGVAYTGTDPVALAKVLVDFGKDHPQVPDARRGGGEGPLHHAQPAGAARAAAGHAPGAGHPAGAAAQHAGEPARAGLEGLRGEADVKICLFRAKGRPRAS